MFTKAWQTTILMSALTVAATAWSEWGRSSIWDEMKKESSAIRGQVKSIAVDDSAKEITVRILAQDKSSVLIKVCPEYNGQIFNHVVNQDKMSLLRQALSDGSEVQVSTGGAFDACVTSVELNRG